MEVNIYDLNANRIDKTSNLMEENMETTIDKNAHYFALMRPVRSMFGMITYTSSLDREKWVECKVVEDRYKIEEGYKITLQSVEEDYSRETYYQEDFLSLLEKGYIIKKTGKQCVKEITWITPLCGAAYIVTKGYVVSEEE